MALCLDKKSAFRTASTIPWMLYWLLAYQPLFSQPSSVLALATGLVLNFCIPTLTFIYASFFSDLLKKAHHEGGGGALGTLEEGGEETGDHGFGAGDARASFTTMRSMHFKDTMLKGGGSGGHHRGAGLAAVSGAVAGAGGARTREMQRQLHQWLEEFARRAPDSDVAQLLQRQNDSDDVGEGRGIATMVLGAPPGRSSSLSDNPPPRKLESGGSTPKRANIGGGAPDQPAVKGRRGSLGTEGPALVRGASSPSLTGFPLTPAAAAAQAGLFAAGVAADAEAASAQDATTAAPLASLWRRGGSRSPITGTAEEEKATEADAAAMTVAAAAERLGQSARSPASSGNVSPSDAGGVEGQEQQHKQQESPVAESPVTFHRSRRRAPVIGRPQRGAGGPRQREGASGANQGPSYPAQLALDSLPAGEEDRRPPEQQAERPRRRSRTVGLAPSPAGTSAAAGEEETSKEHLQQKDPHCGGQETGEKSRAATETLPPGTLDSSSSCPSTTDVASATSKSFTGGYSIDNTDGVRGQPRKEVVAATGTTISGTPEAPQGEGTATSLAQEDRQTARSSILSSGPRDAAADAEAAAAADSGPRVARDVRRRSRPKVIRPSGGGPSSVSLHIPEEGEDAGASKEKKGKHEVAFGEDPATREATATATGAERESAPTDAGGSGDLDRKESPSFSRTRRRTYTHSSSTPTAMRETGGNHREDSKGPSSSMVQTSMGKEIPSKSVSSRLR